MHTCQGLAYLIEREDVERDVVGWILLFFGQIIWSKESVVLFQS